MDAADAFFTQTQNQIYECKARGVFRNKKIKPLVGDFVEIEVLDEEKKLANIEKILERKECLNRTELFANVDQVVMIFAVKNPEPNLGLVDRFLLNMEAQETKVILVLSKIDLDEDGSIRKKISNLSRQAMNLIQFQPRPERGWMNFALYWRERPVSYLDQVELESHPLLMF